MKKILLSAIFTAMGLVPAKAVVLFTEGFGTLADATAISTSNTTFTYVRPSTGASPILEAQNPAAVGTGSSLLIAATTTSLTGVGVSSYSAFTAGEFSFDFRVPATQAAASSLFFAVGTGATFTGNGTFASADLTAAIQILNGQLQYRNSANAWVSLGTPFTASTNYKLQVFFNGSTSSLDYGTGLAGAGTSDIYIDGVLVGDDVSIRNAVTASAFRMYAVSLTASNPYEVDNVLVSSLPVPEPSTLVTLLGGVGMLVGVRRLRGAYGRTHRSSSIIPHHPTVVR